MHSLSYFLQTIVVFHTFSHFTFQLFIQTKNSSFISKRLTFSLQRSISHTNKQTQSRKKEREKKTSKVCKKNMKR